MAKRRPDKKLDFQGNHFGKRECVFSILIPTNFQRMTTKTSRKQVLQT